MIPFSDSRHVEDVLAAYCDGALPDDRAREVVGHLGACQRCRDAYRDVRESHRAASALTLVPMPADRADAVRSTLRAALAAAPPRRSSWRWALPAAAAVLLAFAAVALVALRLAAPGPVLRPTEAASSFARLARDLHVALVDGRMTLDIATGSTKDARAAVRERTGIDTSVAVDRPGVDGESFRLAGVKFADLDGRRTGAFFYNVDGRPVTLLVARDEDVPDAPRWGLGGKQIDVASDPASGLTTLTWRNSGNAYTLVSDLPDAGRRSCFICHTTEERRRQILAVPYGR